MDALQSPPGSDLNKSLNEMTSTQTPRGGMVAQTLEAIIFYGLITLVVLVPLPYGSVEPWAQAVVEGVVFGLTLLWCLHAMLTRSWSGAGGRIFYPMIALAAFAVLQSLSWSDSSVGGLKVVNAISADPFESWIFALRLLSVVLAGALAATFTRSLFRLQLLAGAIIFDALGASVFGIARLTMQHGDGFLLALLRAGGGFAQFINKNHFAFLVEPALGLLLALTLLERGAGHRRLFYISAIILLWAALVMSQTRGGLIAVSLQLILAAVFFVYARGRSIGDKGPARGRTTIIAGLALAGVILVVGVTSIWLGGEQLSTGIETATSEIKSDDVDHWGARRRDIWQATWRMARAHPVFGAGLGGYWAEVPLYHDASGVLTPQQAHNDYLELLASAGIIGLILFCWFAVELFRISRKALGTFTGLQRVLAVGAMIGIAGVAFHSLVEFGLHITCNAFIFVMLLALLSLSPIKQRHTPQAHRSAAFN
jgi:O-antigen ligase